MIKINLIEKRKPLRMPVVLGLDFAEINYKGLLAGLILFYLPDFVVKDQWDKEVSEVEARVKGLKARLTKLNAEVKGSEDLKNKLILYQQQEERLRSRSAQVDSIIREKTNPQKVLERLARNLPEDTWFDVLEVLPSREILISGQSTSYKSIGNFLIAANESLFFGNSLKLKSSSTKDDQDLGGGRRIEEFVIEGKIETFSPY